MVCEVTYEQASYDDSQALDLCRAYSPFEVQNYKKGYPTICTYVKTHQCEDDEQTILDQCIVLKTFRSFDPPVCGDKYSLYTIQHRDERKWICVLVTKAYEVWIGNRPEQVQFLNPRVPEEYKNMDLSRMRIKLQLGSSKLDDIPAGTVLYELPQTELFHACARPARAFEQTLEKLQDSIGNLGLPSGVATDLSGRIRPFTYIPVMIPVQGDQNKAHVQELHEVCKVLPNGYIASLGEFQDIEQFAQLKTRFPSGLYRTTVARMKSVYDDHVYEICNPNKLFEVFRKKFTYYGPNNKTLNVTEDFWKDENPILICADLPRITVAIANAYVDVPAMARRAVICTYGNNPYVSALKNHEQCYKLAHYDENEQRCVCDNPKFEARRRDPQYYGDYPEGVICLECFHYTKGGSIAFVLDDSKSITRDGWFAQKVFMDKLVGILPDTSVAIVMITGQSHVEIKMNYYELIQDRIEDFIATRGHENRWTAVGPAIYEARMMLAKEKYKSKFIVLFSDGDEDKCPHTDSRWCSPHVINRIDMHSVNREADEAWEAGIEIIYILLGTMVDTCDPCKKRVQHIARGYNNVIRVRKFTDIDSSTLARVSKRICNKYQSSYIPPEQ